MSAPPAFLFLFASLVSSPQMPAPTPPPAVSPPAEPVAPLPSIALPPELDRVLRDYEKAWQARDAAALADLFAEDGFVLSDGRPPIRGRGAIHAAYTGSGGALALRALAYSTNGDTGYIIGAFGRASGTPDTGKFLLALKRNAGGRWLIMADMDNSSRRWWPPATPSPSPQPPPTVPAERPR